jgi:hypothetical protein
MSTSCVPHLRPRRRRKSRTATKKFAGDGAVAGRHIETRGAYGLPFFISGLLRATLPRGCNPGRNAEFDSQRLASWFRTSFGFG